MVLEKEKRWNFQVEEDDRELVRLSRFADSVIVKNQYTVIQSAKRLSNTIIHQATTLKNLALHYSPQSFQSHLLYYYE